MFDKMDADGSGRITHDDFLEFARANARKAQMALQSSRKGTKGSTPGAPKQTSTVAPSKERPTAAKAPAAARAAEGAAPSYRQNYSQNYSQNAPSDTVPNDRANPFVGVSAGENHSLGLRADGSIQGWGANQHGQVNVPNDRRNPFVAVSAGGAHSLGLRADGSIVAWGSNAFGQAPAPLPPAPAAEGAPPAHGPGSLPPIANPSAPASFQIDAPARSGGSPLGKGAPLQPIHRAPPSGPA